MSQRVIFDCEETSGDPISHIPRQRLLLRWTHAVELRQQFSLLRISSVAKGFAVDRVSEALGRLGIGHHLVEIGGELRGSGIKPDGSHAHDRFHREEQAKMRAWIAPIAALLVTTTVAAAQSPIPSLKGTWKGTGKILLFGTTEYLSGSPKKEAAVRDLEVTHTVLGQDGRLIWGTTSAGNNDVKEPFAWAVTADNKTIIGADTDGYYRITILSPDQMEKCYVQNAASSRQAIVASCFVMSRVNP
jgi:ApbE family